MFWMPTAEFPAEGEVKKDIVYGFNEEFTGLLNIDSPNSIVGIENLEIRIVPESIAPPGPTNGDIEYGS